VGNPYHIRKAINVESSADDAILLLNKWKDNSSILRIIFGNDHAEMTLHGRLADVNAESALAHGASVEEDFKTSFAGAKFAFIDDRGLSSEFKALLTPFVREVVSIAWLDRTRITIVLEKQSPLAED